MQTSLLFLILSLATLAVGARNYNNCVVLNDQYDIRLYWNLQSESNTIDIKIQSTAVNGYTAVGLSTDGSMNSGGGKDFSDAWVMGFTTKAGDKCSLTETSGGCIGDLKITQHSQPAWDDNQSLSGVQVGHNTNYIWGEFSRALQTNDTDDKPIPSKGNQFIIYSVHPSFTISWGELTYHMAKGSKQVNFGELSTCPETSSSSTEYSSTSESYSQDGTTGETTGDVDVTSSGKETSGSTSSKESTSTSGSTSVPSGSTSSSGSEMVYLVTMDITSTISVDKDVFSTAMALANSVAKDRIVIVSFTLTNTTARAHYHYQTEFYYKDQPNGPSSQSLATKTQSLANTTLTPEISIGAVSVKYTSAPTSDVASEAVYTTISAILVVASMIFST